MAIARPTLRRAGLLARYDATLMRPPEGDATAARAVLRAPPGALLLDWCHAPGPLDAASLEGPDADALALALALHLDGSDRLAACGSAAARLALRLRVKAEDLAARWRGPRRSDCWDSGWLADDDDALARLAGWQPRRATLLLVADVQAPRWLAACRLLAARAATLARPVRLLRVVVTPASSAQSFRLMREDGAPVMADKSITETV